MPYSTMPARPDTSSSFSASISAGSPWQSHPKRRSTRLPRMVWYRGTASFTKPVKMWP
jgi:hypothetical protein